MNISCNIIEDLMPLYHDEVCSEESKKLIEEHLKECNECRNYLKSLRSENFQEKININTEEVKITALKELKKRLFRKNVKVSIVSIFSVIAVFIISYPLIFKLELPIHYKDGLIGVQQVEDNNVKFSFLGDDFYKCHYLQGRVDIDGEEKNILMIYYTNTIWTKLSSKQQYVSDSSTYLISQEETYNLGWTLENWENIIVDKEIDEVYYVVENYDKLVDKQLDSTLEKAALLWER